VSDRLRYFVQIGCKKLLRRNSALRHCACSARLDELDVSYAHESEDEAEIRKFLVQRTQSRFLVAASARDDRKYLFVLASQQPFRRTGGRVTESLSGSHHMINPCLQSSRNREVVHRSCNNDFIGCQDFRHQFIRECKCFLMVFIVPFGRREGACNPIEINKRKRGSG
jgi:hypothetical protein